MTGGHHQRQSLFWVVVGLLALSTAAATKWSESLGEEYLEYSLAAFCEETEIHSWDCPYCKELKDFEIKGAVGSESSPTFGFMGIETSSKQIIVSFRGITQTNGATWYDGLSKLTKTSLVSCPWVEGGLVYNSFLSAYEAINVQLFSELGPIWKANPTYPIVLVGHSYGGVIASLAAAEITNRTKASVELWTYAVPRVGNDAFAATLMKKVPTLYRHTNELDPFVHYPTEAAGYLHPAEEIFYNGKDFKSCSTTNGEDPSCADQYTNPKDYLLGDAYTYFKLPILCGKAPTSSTSKTSSGTTKTSSGGSSTKTSSGAASNGHSWSTSKGKGGSSFGNAASSSGGSSGDGSFSSFSGGKSGGGGGTFSSGGGGGGSSGGGGSYFGRQAFLIDADN